MIWIDQHRFGPAGPSNPTVTINQAATQIDPAPLGGAVKFTIVFSEAVSGFTAADISLSGTASPSVVKLHGSGPTYTAVVAGMTSSGTVIASIGASVVTSVSTGLPNLASTSTDNTITMAGPGVIGSVAVQDPREVALIGDGTQYLFVSSGHATGRCYTVDISNPAAPTVADSIFSSEFNDSRGCYVDGNYAFVCSGSQDRLTIVDITDPTNISIAGSVAHSTNLNAPEDVVVAGNYAFVTEAGGGGSRVYVVDVSNKAAPSIVTSVTNANFDFNTGIAYQGGYVFVTTRDFDRLASIDVSTPGSPGTPVFLNHATNLDQPWAVAVDGDYAYVACDVQDRLTVVDISNPASMSIVGTLQDATQLNGARKVFYADGYCYVGCEAGDRVTVVDVTTPGTPVVIASVTDTLLDNCLGTAWNGSHMFGCGRTGSSNGRLVVIGV